MRNRIIALFSLAIVVIASAAAQSAGNDGWVGIWHADVNGRPTGTLTLATDTGVLGGTVVLDMIEDNNGTARLIASEPHVLMNPQVSGNTLSFQVKMNRPDGIAVMQTFTVKLMAARKASIHCTSCGDAPVVELTRDR